MAWEKSSKFIRQKAFFWSNYKNPLHVSSRALS
jgi:hypothetical protein